MVLLGNAGGFLGLDSDSRCPAVGMGGREVTCQPRCVSGVLLSERAKNVTGSSDEACWLPGYQAR